MYRVILIGLAVTVIGACSSKKLVQRLPGNWYIDHYDEYSQANDKSTGHDLDGTGYMWFSKNGKVGRHIKSNKPHGHLEGFDGYKWQLSDSLVTISDRNGNVVEEWLVTKDLTDYMELVSVNRQRDSVRTMYLKK